MLYVHRVHNKGGVFDIMLDSADDLCDIRTVRVNYNHGNYVMVRLGEEKRELYLHSIIVGDTPDGFQVDHIDGNPLNNTRCNLRFVTAQQNLLNRCTPNSTGYAGVKPSGGKYLAQVSLNRKNLYIGTFDMPEEAAMMRDEVKASLSISCDDNILPAVQAIDDRMRQVLADNSEALFGMKCTPEMVGKYKFYTPLAYSKEESSLPPLAGGKVLPSTIVEDHLGHTMMKSSAILASLAEAVPAGSKIKVLLSITSLYFQAETKCKLTVKVERIQIVEAGTDVAEVADYSFDD